MIWNPLQPASPSARKYLLPRSFAPTILARPISPGEAPKARSGRARLFWRAGARLPLCRTCSRFCERRIRSEGGFAVTRQFHQKASALRHADRLLLRLALARLTFSRMSLAFAVQIKGLGWRLCSWI